MTGVNRMHTMKKSHPGLGWADSRTITECSGGKMLGLAGAGWGGSSINTSGDLSLEEAYQVCGLMDPL